MQRTTSHSGIASPPRSRTRTTAMAAAAVIVAIVAMQANARPVAGAEALVSVQDRFQRVVERGWGATAGLRYRPGGDSSDLWVNGAAGVIRLDRPGTARRVSFSSFVVRDLDMRFDLRADRAAAGGNQRIDAVGRQDDAGSEYRAGLRFEAGGKVTIVVNRFTSGVRRSLGESTLGRWAGASPGYLSLRVQMMGGSPTTIRVKVWPSGGDEPSGWSYQTTDGARQLQDRGDTGFRAWLSPLATNAPALFRIDDLTVRDRRSGDGSGDPGPIPPPIPSPTPTPTPRATPDPTPRPTREPTPEPTESPRATPRPTTTPEPTRTPEPTPAPTRAPTPTPAPTATPTPAPTTTPTPVPANVYHVSTSGSDSNPGTAGAPWRTLQKAADAVPAGATVQVAAGTYEGFTMRRSGESGDPVVFQGRPGDARPVIAGDPSTVNVIRLVGVRDVQIRDFVVQGAAADISGAGIRVERSSRVFVSGNLVRENQSYGINLYDSTYVTVSDNEVTRNAEGIYVRYGGEGHVISGNRVHHQDRLVKNTPDIRGDDHGAVGIAFVKSTGRIVARDNELWANRAPSYDYGWDGGAFEIYGASNVRMVGNRMWDNKNVLETGTDGTVCADNVFARNVAYGATTAGNSVGMMLRCDVRMLIANNTLYDLDEWVFTITADGGYYGGSIEGLSILNNILWMRDGRIYSIGSDLPDSVKIDRNVVHRADGGPVAYVNGRGATASLSTFRSWTGFDMTGVWSDPSFRDSGSYDLRLRSDSPAVDGAMSVPGITDSYAGAGPDMGRHEYGE